MACITILKGLQKLKDTASSQLFSAVQTI